MSKIRTKALEQAINLAVSLRRKVVDVRLDRTQESKLLDKTSDLIQDLETLALAQVAEPQGETAGNADAVPADVERSRKRTKEVSHGS